MDAIYEGYDRKWRVLRLPKSMGRETKGTANKEMD